MKPLQNFRALTYVLTHLVNCCFPLKHWCPGVWGLGVGIATQKRKHLSLTFGRFGLFLKYQLSSISLMSLHLPICKMGHYLVSLLPSHQVFEKTRWNYKPANPLWTAKLYLCTTFMFQSWLHPPNPTAGVAQPQHTLVQKSWRISRFTLDELSKPIIFINLFAPPLFPNLSSKIAC